MLFIFSSLCNPPQIIFSAHGPCQFWLSWIYYMKPVSFKHV